VALAREGRYRERVGECKVINPDVGSGRKDCTLRSAENGQPVATAAGTEIIASSRVFTVGPVDF
jgi:hypothetical protein